MLVAQFTRITPTPERSNVGSIIHKNKTTPEGSNVGSIIHKNKPTPEGSNVCRKGLI